MIRLFDIILSSLLLLVFSPVILLLCVLVLFKLKRPIFFQQLRAGCYGKPFTLYKFRTMSSAADSEGNLLADHQRLHPLGKWMRRYSLDELPQLWNVLKGDMSLVGPRPLLIEYSHYYSPEQAVRLRVKPGITGWAQINGRNAIAWSEKFKLDSWFVENQNSVLYLKILFLTFKQVITGHGVQQSEQVTMEKFKGERW